MREAIFSKVKEFVSFVKNEIWAVEDEFSGFRGSFFHLQHHVKII